MATAQEKVLENIDKVAMANYAPYDKVLAVVRTDIDPRNTTLSAGGTYDAVVTLDNPLGYRALPVTFINQIWVDFGGLGGLGIVPTPDVDLIQMPAKYNLLVSAITTVTDTQIKIYYSYASFLTFGYEAYVMLLEM